MATTVIMPRVEEQLLEAAVADVGIAEVDGEVVPVTWGMFQEDGLAPR
jgi:hypothetical protein